MKQGKFVYWKSDKNGQWYWHLKARNGQIICQSEGYKRKAGCLNGIASVITHARTGVVGEL